jgi:Holliday junction resolvase RusA-like endonuclease
MYCKPSIQYALIAGYKSWPLSLTFNCNFFLGESQGQGQFKTSRPKLSQAQVKVAKHAMRQALAWNEDDDMGVSKSTALKIVVLEGMNNNPSPPPY